ncbi:hypothetical protein PP175_27195 (plasmid) [Aneurinibacillus sp. Ricciae_BoGa-3]|uniref:dTMP kinase n=1 Tax=Aneurinibacillus sp. Ricciae_BoGa-3 TaxID=3022697 RepID=UPI002341FACC|nr:hypothetical protein [Aneurinibacillus sp. Ricciae_BoGa-3]WCK57725.1 hypothetical protein PP175_27195 [Aneurinibacillus sp. Ricciae_BoGa-3]
MNTGKSNAGHVFVIDGTDSSGKQTVSDAVYTKLKENGYQVQKVSYPNYDSASSALVKMYLNGEFGDNADEVNPYTASSFYAVDRIASYLKEWKKFYESGGIIIADRYTTSNAIHQASKIHNETERLAFLEWLWDLEFTKLGLPIPSEVIFLNMPIQNSMKLMAERMNKITGESAKDIHESNLEFMKQSYENACWVADKQQWKAISCITTESWEEKIAKDIPGDLRPLDAIITDAYTLIVERMK